MHDVPRPLQQSQQKERLPQTSQKPQKPQKPQEKPRKQAALPLPVKEVHDVDLLHGNFGTAWTFFGATFPTEPGSQWSEGTEHRLQCGQAPRLLVRRDPPPPPPRVPPLSPP